MSIWVSVGCCESLKPVIYDSGYGDTICDDGFLDVAVSCWDSRVRVIATSEGENGLSLDHDGVAELIRRLTLALDQMARR